MFKIKQIGNSRGIIIDKDIADLIGLKVGDWCEVSIEKVIDKNNDKKKQGI